MKAIMKVARGVGNVEVRDIGEPQVGDGQVKIRGNLVEIADILPEAPSGR